MYLIRDYLIAKTMRILKNVFEGQNGRDENVSRRAVLRGLLASGAGVALASLPFGHDAEASERNSFDDMRDMRHYSEDSATQGIGVFINMQADAVVTGEQIGENLRRAFAGLNPPVPLEYRVNQSQGTATDITFYVKGYDFTINIADLKTELRQVLAHHRDLWPTAQVSLNTQPQ